MNKKERLLLEAIAGVGIHINNELNKCSSEEEQIMVERNAGRFFSILGMFLRVSSHLRYKNIPSNPTTTWLMNRIMDVSNGIASGKDANEVFKEMVS